MSGWFGGSARVEALESELAALRDAIAGHAAAEAESARTLRETQETMAALAARLAAIEERCEGVLPAIAAAAERLERLESDPDPREGEMVEVRATLLRIDRQLRAQAAEADTASRALLERIEALRHRLGGLR